MLDFNEQRSAYTWYALRMAVARGLHIGYSCWNRPVYALHMTMSGNRGPMPGYRPLAALVTSESMGMVSRNCRGLGGQGSEVTRPGERVKWCRVVPLKVTLARVPSTSDQHQNQHWNQLTRTHQANFSKEVANDLITIPGTFLRFVCTRRPFKTMLLGLINQQTSCTCS